MRMRFPFRLLTAECLAVAMLFILSCQPRSVPVAPQPAPEMPSLPTLLQQLKTRQSNIRDVKTFARTKISGKRLKQSFRQTVLVRGGDAIRVDTFNLFRQIVGVLILEGGHTLMYDPGNNRIARGQEVWDMMQKVMGSSIDFREYIRVFSGGIPRLSHLQATAVGWNSDKTLYRVETIDTGTGDRVDIEIDAYTLLPATVTRRRGDDELYRVRWDDYRKVDEWNFAHRIVIELRDRDETITVKYSDPVINQGLAPDAFQFPGPGRTGD